MTTCEANHLVRTIPFRYMIFTAWLSTKTIETVLEKLEQFVWEKDSLPLHRFSIPTNEQQGQAILQDLDGELLTEKRKKLLEHNFECELGSTPILELHRYTNGDGIAPHTDHQLPEVRIVLNVNRQWQIGDGGVWVLSSDATLHQHTTYLPAICNTGFVFSTSQNSYHALAQYTGQEMFGLVFRIPRIL